jgi:hypothetical protein
MRPARTTTALLAVLTLTAACGTTQSPGSASRAASSAAAWTSVSVAQATRLVYTYSAVNNLVNSSYSAALDRTIEESPASVASITGLKIAKTQGSAIPATQYFGSTFAVPRITGYPRLLLAITHLRSSGTTLPYTIYLLFVQDAAGAPWRVAYYPFSTGQVPVPAVATSADDSAPAVTSGTGLLADPAVLSAAIYAHATGQNASAVPLAPTPELDQQLTAGYASGVQQYNSQGVNVHETLLSAAFPSYLVRTQGGGALAFTADEVRDLLVPMHSEGSVHLAQGSGEAALAGQPGGATASGYSVIRLQMFMSYIPPRNAPGNGVEVLSYADYPISVSLAGPLPEGNAPHGTPRARRVRQRLHQGPNLGLVKREIRRLAHQRPRRRPGREGSGGPGRSDRHHHP